MVKLVCSVSGKSAMYIEYSMGRKTLPVVLQIGWCGVYSTVLDIVPEKSCR